MTARVLVTGVGGPAGRSLSRQLVARGHAVVGVDMVPIAIDGVDVHLVPPAADPHFLPVLWALAQRERVDLVVPTVTEELVVVAAAEGSHAVPTVVGGADAVVVANDKLLTCLRLRAAGIAVPRFALPSQVSDSPDVVGLLGLPFISKPREGRGGRNTSLHEEAAPAMFRALGDFMILQEFIPGVEYRAEPLPRCGSPRRCRRRA